jgi:urea carboxylase-associated protein 2
MHLYDTVLPGGKHWSLVIRRHTQLVLTDVDGGANAGMLLYNPENLLERYNAPDTLKCQHTFRLTAGHCLYSDMGRIFCSITADTLGWHDTAGGTSTRATLPQHASYQEVRNDWKQNGRDAFLVEGAKYGLGRRDLAANVNWFSKVSVDADGAMQFHPDHSPPGAQVTLRFEMDTLVLLHTCPHPMDASGRTSRLGIALSQAEPPAAEDPCLTSPPENCRGAQNNAIYHQTSHKFAALGSKVVS